ncbi:4-hydroxy-tetrahydrodipicolinate synthase [Microcystis sp. LE19-195.1E]|uniref:4-hydroxy-tetrahydrodipicolinate synthase n=1 Tax=Microcystis sp. LE19-195.1E TaxID=3016440 RepID=UPI0022C0370B|nr:4-hydroxy-tetrahydrodipicolinate synthase [Microcystis sp. LE19-195.1E]MCZ8247941.1 4-hydroxy-tetrahydrodipicolinate synthase [Microcystis sp. LE19-195.1E]
MSETTYFGRVITAMVTPFTVEGQVNYALVEKLADYLVTHGSDGIVVCGTTGESPTLSWQEEYELFSIVKKAVNGRGKVIAGTGSNSTSEAIEATQQAAKLGLDGSLQVVPYYNKPPQEGLYEHFLTIAKACPDLPVMLYNIPGRTGQNMTPETIIKLAAVDNIVAVKEASGNLEQTCKIYCHTPENFAIYSGDDFLTLPLMTCGAVGVVSVASHLVGEEIQGMIQALLTGDAAKAIKINLKLFPLFKGLFCATNPIPIKAALNLVGWEVGGLRSPLCSLSPELEEGLAKIMQELALI